MPENSLNGESAATASATGASATEQFLERVKVAGLGSANQERLSHLAGSLIKAINDIVLREKVTYDEYNAFKAWLIRLGEDGEVPLFLDVWVEHSVEEVAGADRDGSKGAIEGPFYLPDAPRIEWNGTIQKRDDEPGTPLVFQGMVRSVDGTPLTDATVELWTADALGFYSQFAQGVPDWNLRCVFGVNESGNFAVNIMKPAPYQIPTDGACGQLIAGAGWHAWRPAHIHLKVQAPGHQLVTTQLYFPGDPHNADDVAGAVKPELLLEVHPTGNGDELQTIYDFVLDRV